jgi:hypothetical protein
MLFQRLALNEEMGMRMREVAGTSFFWELQIMVGPTLGVAYFAVA